MIQCKWQVIALFYEQTCMFIYTIIYSGWSLAWIFMREWVKLYIHVKCTKYKTHVTLTKFHIFYNYCHCASKKKSITYMFYLCIFNRSRCGEANNQLAFYPWVPSLFPSSSSLTNDTLHHGPVSMWSELLVGRITQTHSPELLGN